MTRIHTDDLNGIWWVAHTQVGKDWPASVVEDLAAELIEARGGSTAAVAAAMRERGVEPAFEPQPMIAAHHGITSERYEMPAPEFDPRDVEREVFDQSPTS